MKQYLLGIYPPDGPVPPPEVLEPIMRDVADLEQQMRDAGAWVFTAALHPADTATVVRTRGEETLVTDGPFSEGKEHLGGFNIIRAPDLDAALEWGRRLARATGLPVEVRPVQDLPG